MKKEYLDVISEYMGVEPIMINSALVSAQNRVRYYWTNIPGIEQPEQRGIVLRDILETREIDGLSDKAIAYMNRGSEKWSGGKSRAEHYIKHESKKYNCLTANMHKGVPYGVIAVDKPVKVGMNVEQVKVRKHEVDIISLQYLLREMKKESCKTNKQIAEETNTAITKVEHWFRTDSSFAIPSDDVWLKLKEVLGIETDLFDKQIMEFEYRDGVYESKQRVYSENGKSPTLTAGNSEQYIETHDTPKQVGTAVDIKGHDQIKRVYSPDGKSSTLTTCGGGHREPKVAVFSKDRINKFKETLKDDPKPSANGIIQLNNPSHSSGRVYSPDGKSPTLMAGNSGGGKEPVKIREVISVDKRKPNQINPSKKANEVQPYMQDRVFHVDGKSHALTREFASRTNVGETIEVNKDKKQLTIKEATKKGYTTIEDGDCFDMTFPKSKTRRGRNMKDKSNCLTAANYDYMRYEHSDEDKEVYWRKLTPVECERLQTVPDNYTNHVSNTQRYKRLGNGWTIEVITHILKNMEL